MVGFKKESLVKRSCKKSHTKSTLKDRALAHSSRGSATAKSSKPAQPTKRREKTTITKTRETMADDDDDAATFLQQLLEDLSIYTPNSLLEPSKSLPSTQDLASINSASALRALQILRLYIRPRNEVLRIRRAVTAAFENEEIGSGNVYVRHALLKRELEELRNEKSVLEEELRTIRGGNSSRGK